MENDKLRDDIPREREKEVIAGGKVHVRDKNNTLPSRFMECS